MKLRGRQTIALTQCLLENQGKEHLIGHWMSLVNAKLPDKKKFQNTKSLGRFFLSVRVTGYTIRRKTKTLSSNGDSYCAKFYSCVREEVMDDKKI